MTVELRVAQQRRTVPVCVCPPRLMSHAVLIACPRRASAKRNAPSAVHDDPARKRTSARPRQKRTDARYAALMLMLSAAL